MIKKQLKKRKINSTSISTWYKNSFVIFTFWYRANLSSGSARVANGQWTPYLAGCTRVRTDTRISCTIGPGIHAWPSPLLSFQQRDSNKRENNIIHRNKNRGCAENPRWKSLSSLTSARVWNVNHFPRLPLTRGQNRVN